MNEFLEQIVNSGLTLPLLLLTLLLTFVPLARARIFPSYAAALMLLVPSGVAVATAIWPSTAIIAVIADAIIVAILLIDLISRGRPEDLTAERETSRAASLNKRQEVQLTIANQSKRRLQMWVRDDTPQEFQCEPEEFSLNLQGRTQAILTYRFRPMERGEFTMDRVHVRVRSRWGFWNRYLELPCETKIHVYPDMKQLHEFALLARTNRLSLMGVRRTRRIGQDNEFERLRDYLHDDNYKHIDWRTTARRRRLTVKDFQTNQSQRVIFMIDCGRMMTNEAAGLSLLDHSFNAMLMLTYVALQRGDSVGMICFSDKVHSYIPARSGKNQMNQILHAAHNQFPQMVESRYDEAFLHLSKYCRKRSLVVLISNLIDEVNANRLEEHLGVIVGRHLPLGILLRDRQMFDAADNPRARETDQDLFRAAAAAEILSWRHQVLVDLEHRGVRKLDVYPEEMTAPLINEYLMIKARHLL